MAAADLPTKARFRVTEAIHRLVDLYDAIDQKDKAAECRTTLEVAKLAGHANAKPPQHESK